MNYKRHKSKESYDDEDYEEWQLQEEDEEQNKEKDNSDEELNLERFTYEDVNKNNLQKQKNIKSMMAIEIDNNQQGDSFKIFQGKTIVVTGLFQNHERAALENMLKDLGARVTGSVSKKTNYLIYGYQLEDGRPVETSNKFKQATDKGTQKLNEAELEEIITKSTGKLLSNQKQFN